MSSIRQPSGCEGAVYRGLLEEVQQACRQARAGHHLRLQCRAAADAGRSRRAKPGASFASPGARSTGSSRSAQDNGYLEAFPDADRFRHRDGPAARRGADHGDRRAGRAARRACAALPRTTTRSSLAAGDVVLFSSRQIPGNEIAIGRVQNQLAERGIVMVTDRQSEIHVSGHPGRPELEALYGWLRPEILVPVHGEIRHMQEQARLGRASGHCAQRVPEERRYRPPCARQAGQARAKCRPDGSCSMATSSCRPTAMRSPCAAGCRATVC